MVSDKEFLQNVGAELRSLRLKAGLSLEVVASALDRKRDNLSKIELGQRNMTLVDYLKLMHIYRREAPDHLSHALLAHLTTKRRKRA